MNYLEKVINNCKFIYSEINAATLTGAIDVVVVEQSDGTFTCSPFHVRFGKMGVLRSKEKVVDIEINGEAVDIHMKLGESGEAFFVEEVLEEEEDIIPPHLATSPIPPDGERCFPPPTDWRVDKPLSDDLEGIEEGGVPVAKTFKAETVEEVSGQQRKTSAPSTDFRPIDSRSSDGGSSSKESITNTPFAKEDSPSGDEGLGVNGGGGGVGGGGSGGAGKRKRRKRSTKKRQQGQVKRNSLAASQEGQEQLQSPDGDIFTMDDLDPSLPSNPAQVSSQQMEIRAVEIASLELPVEREIHFFSDTEITPGSSPREDYGAVGPVQSDTEFETNKERVVDVNGQSVAEDRSQSWKWGELPTTTPSPDHDTKHHSQKWMANMLGFMKKTKHMRHENEGVYLSELNLDDPEISSLYLSTLQDRHQSTQEECREEDAESGNGPSLPQSPHSVEGSICCQKSCMLQQLNYIPKWPVDVALSTCGAGGTEEQFSRHLITYADLVSDPGLIFSPKLVVRLDGKVLPWKQAAPLIMSLIAFRKPLPDEVINRLAEDPVGVEVAKEIPQTQTARTYKSWFSWGKNGIVQEPLVEVKEEIGKTESEQKGETLGVDTVVEPQEHPLDLSIQGVTADDEEAKKEELETPTEKYRKTLRLTSEQIEQLNLQHGANEVEFSVTTAYQGTSKCKCYLFRWRYDDKIVVSDIDGTITKSDVLGHILPIVGKDWAQSGVAKLFTRIKENGYKLLYLSARAIGQSRLTRDYLKSIKQEDLNLPEGPVLLNPTSLLHAFHTEVIEKKPEEFKISCLRDIQALFPIHSKPFYAGYGNKINDVWAYQAVGIPIFRIFTINHRGELKHELTETFQSTYSSMSNLADQMFPIAKPNHVEYDFSEFVYWRDPILDINSLPVL